MLGKVLVNSASPSLVDATTTSSLILYITS